MLKKLAILAVTAGAMTAALPAPQADAGTRVYVGFGRPYYAYRPYYYAPRYYAPVYSYGYAARPVVYNDGCSWMKRRAINQGSGYWWSRYRACRGY
jgi:hypothetical protein